MSLNPKYLTHFYRAVEGQIPHVVNIYVDYNCVFLRKLYLNWTEDVIPEIEAKHPGKFQFVYINVVQPWHPNSVFVNEFALAVSKAIRDANVAKPNDVFWKFNQVVYEKSTLWYDLSTVTYGRDKVYSYIYDEIAKQFEFPVEKSQILKLLEIAPNTESPENNGNEITNDLKYFTKLLRTTNVHVTPSIQIDGVNIGDIESSTASADVIKKLESHLF